MVRSHRSWNAAVWCGVVASVMWGDVPWVVIGGAGAAVLRCPGLCAAGWAVAGCCAARNDDESDELDIRG